MPFGDKTGPLGQGPMTGHGRGFCAGYAASGSFNPGRGAGMGRGEGSGRGWRNRFRAAVSSASETSTASLPKLADRPQEIASLKDVIDNMLSILGGIRKRVEELDSAPKTESALLCGRAKCNLVVFI